MTVPTEVQLDYGSMFWKTDDGSPEKLESPSPRAVDGDRETYSEDDGKDDSYQPSEGASPAAEEPRMTRSRAKSQRGKPCLLYTSPSPRD